MTKPPKKIRRNYLGRDGEKLPSVTTIIGLLNKPALIEWSARIAAEATAAAIIDGGMPREAAILAGKGAPSRTRDKAADLGTRAHDLVERHCAGETVVVDVSDPDDARVHGCYQRVIDHLAATETTVVVSEMQLVDLDLGFGGTCDFVLQRDARLIMGDMKTGKQAHDEVVIQLAAYRWLYERETGRLITGGGVVVHSPIDGLCTEVAITTDQLDAGRHIFGCLLEIYKALPMTKLNRITLDVEAL